MLFLDDFLEMLEELPAELQERSRQIEFLDRDVEKRMKKYNEERKEFFEKTGVNMTAEQRKERYQALLGDLQIIRGLGETKCKISDKIGELLVKYSAHLEKEKTNFQCEMEADNSGVTETIEKRYTEYVDSMVSARKDRKRKKPSSRDGGAATSGVLTKESSEKIVKILHENSKLRMDFSDESASHSPMSSAIPSPAPRGRPPKLSTLYTPSLLSTNDEHLSSPQTPPIRRRSNANSIRNSISMNNPPSRMSPNLSEKSWSNAGIDESPTSAPAPTFPPVQTPQQPPIVSAFNGSESRHGRPRKLTSRVQEMFKETLQRQRNHGNSMLSMQDRIQAVNSLPPPQPPQQPVMPLQQPPPLHNGPPPENRENGSDDDEDVEDSRRWCFCNEKSYGAMVACDNKSCPYMWFHNPCVGILSPPKGKWFCPHCIGTSDIPNEDSSFPSTSNVIL